jgi:hypothetical protein
MKTCPTCNAPASDVDAFCGSCGAKIGAPTETPPASPSAPNTTPPAVATTAATPSGSSSAGTITIIEAPRRLTVLSYLVMAAAALSATAVIPGLLALRYQGDSSFAARQAIDDLAGIAALLWYAGFIVGAILFMALLNRLRHNLNRLNVSGLRYGADQAIWPWFIPFFNWFRPVRFVSDLDRGLRGRSTRPGREQFSTGTNAATSPVIAIWWTVWILQVFTSRGIEMSGSVAGVLAACIIWGAGGVLTAVLVYQLLQLNLKAIAAFESPAV